MSWNDTINVVGFVTNLLRRRETPQPIPTNNSLGNTHTLPDTSAPALTESPVSPLLQHKYSTPEVQLTPTLCEQPIPTTCQRCTLSQNLSTPTETIHVDPDDPALDAIEVGDVVMYLDDSLRTTIVVVVQCQDDASLWPGPATPVLIRDLVQTSTTLSVTVLSSSLQSLRSAFGSTPDDLKPWVSSQPCSCTPTPHQPVTQTRDDAPFPFMPPKEGVSGCSLCPCEECLCPTFVPQEFLDHHYSCRDCADKCSNVPRSNYTTYLQATPPQDVDLTRVPTQILFGIFDNQHSVGQTDYMSRMYLILQTVTRCSVNGSNQFFTYQSHGGGFNSSLSMFNRKFSSTGSLTKVLARQLAARYAVEFASSIWSARLQHAHVQKPGPPLHTSTPSSPYDPSHDSLVHDSPVSEGDGHSDPAQDCVSSALQRAVDDGCVTADGSDTHSWNWQRPLILSHYGPMSEGGGDTLPILCPINFDPELSPELDRPHQDLVFQVFNNGWYMELGQAIYNMKKRIRFQGPHRQIYWASITTTLGVRVSGKITCMGPGRKLWTPSTHRVNNDTAQLLREIQPKDPPPPVLQLPSGVIPPQLCGDPDHTKTPMWCDTPRDPSDTRFPLVTRKHNDMSHQDQQHQETESNTVHPMQIEIRFAPQHVTCYQSTDVGHLESIILSCLQLPQDPQLHLDTTSIQIHEEGNGDTVAVCYMSLAASLYVNDATDETGLGSMIDTRLRQPVLRPLTTPRRTSCGPNSDDWLPPQGQPLVTIKLLGDSWRKNAHQLNCSMTRVSIRFQVHPRHINQSELVTLIRTYLTSLGTEQVTDTKINVMTYARTQIDPQISHLETPMSQAEARHLFKLLCQAPSRWLHDFDRLTEPITWLLDQHPDTILPWPRCWGPAQENSFRNLVNRICDIPDCVIADVGVSVNIASKIDTSRSTHGLGHMIQSQLSTYDPEGWKVDVDSQFVSQVWFGNFIYDEWMTRTTVSHLHRDHHSGHGDLFNGGTAMMCIRFHFPFIPADPSSPKSMILAALHEHLIRDDRHTVEVKPLTHPERVNFFEAFIFIGKRDANEIILDPGRGLFGDSMRTSVSYMMQDNQDLTTSVLYLPPGHDSGHYNLFHAGTAMLRTTLSFPYVPSDPSVPPRVLLEALAKYINRDDRWTVDIRPNSCPLSFNSYDTCIFIDKTDAQHIINAIGLAAMGQIIQTHVTSCMERLGDLEQGCLRATAFTVDSYRRKRSLTDADSDSEESE